VGEHVIGTTADIPEGEARRFEVDGHEIAVVNLGGGELRALSDICSHAEAYLHEGEVDTDFETIECPRHGSSFDLETGEPKALPATRPVPVYQLSVTDDKITITIPDRGE
jgi:3-phenylpropionate/trans-cinnamate dioxygenase ferredoxin subunit